MLGLLTGSSPRGRGKRDPRRNRRRPARLIPAWAGKTWRLFGRGGRIAAHPRVGGENSGCRGVQGVLSGSSPRGRGKRRTHGPLHGPARLIPAWAGKTTSALTCVSARRAHPRVGGENSILSPALERSAGSSPRGRGKPGGRPRLAHLLRLIPAWAGKTRSAPPSRSRSAAHPRVGGENSGPGARSRP